MAQHEVLSPLPGIFYRRPAPEKPAYKEHGDQVATLIDDPRTRGEALFLMKEHGYRSKEISGPNEMLFVHD